MRPIRFALLAVAVSAGTAQAQAPSMARLRELEAACGSHWGECGTTLDSAQLAVAGRQAFRDSLGVHVRLASGAYLLLARDTTDWPATYQFHAWLPRVSQYLIHLQYFEGDGYMLLDARTSARIYLDDIPVFSPSGDRFAVASGDTETNYNPTSLSVWRITRTEVIQEWRWADSALTAGWAPQAARWKNEVTIEADYLYGDPDSGELTAAHPLQLVRRNGQWTLALPTRIPRNTD
jgi:hypothetical protein